MFNCKFAGLTSIVTLLISATTYAQGDFSFQQPILNGTGCKPGEAVVVLSPNSQEMSILFNDFKVEVPQFSGNNDNNDESAADDEGGVAARNDKNIEHKMCNINVKANIPVGYKVKSLDATFYYRGYVFAERGTRVVFRSNLIGKSGLGTQQGGRKEQILNQVWMSRTPEAIDEDFTYSTTGSVAIKSKCARNNERVINLKLKNFMRAAIRPNFRNRPTLPTANLFLDSIDASGSLKYKLVLERCVN